jgi:hypothetical protein
MSRVVKPAQRASLSHYILGVDGDVILKKNEEYSTSLVEAYKEVLIVELLYTIWPHMSNVFVDQVALQPPARLSSWLRNADKVKTKFAPLNSCCVCFALCFNAAEKKLLVSTLLVFQVETSREVLCEAVSSIHDGMAKIQEYGGEAFFLQCTSCSPQVSFFFFFFFFSFPSMTVPCIRCCLIKISTSLIASSVPLNSSGKK